MARRHQKIFEFPWCIYCGGGILATTADHVPPITMFDNRDRPKGLEFPSCELCNRGTKLSELVVSAISRMYPDPTTEAGSAEVKRLLHDVNKGEPGILEEMQVPRAKAKLASKKYNVEEGGFLRLSGPLVSAHLAKFAAKLGFAFHYHETKKAIPVGGAVATIIHTNLDALDGKIPNDLLEIMGLPRTLAQGVKNVGEQFGYSVVKANDADMSASFCSFRRSIAFTTFAAHAKDRLLVEGQPFPSMFEPGFAQKPIQRHEFRRISFWTQL